MKRMVLALVALFVMTIQASAMSYEQAREQALFLTDKMAYELNLTDDQYEAAFEINLDYLMSVNTQADLYGDYWNWRNLDLSYVLYDWQYQAYLAASYFYRPLYWDAGFWHFAIFARYPHRDYFFFGRPLFYATYRGGHAWHRNGNRSWYHGREFGAPRGGQARIGMRDGFNRGDYGRGGSINRSPARSNSQGSRSGTQQSSNRSQSGVTGGSNRTTSTQQNGSRTFGQSNTTSQSRPRSVGSTSRESSTRTTATRQTNSRSFGSQSNSSTPRSTFSPSRGSSRNSSATTSRSSSSVRGSSGVRSSSKTPSRSSSSVRSSSRTPSRSTSSGAKASSGHSSGAKASGGHSGGAKASGGHSGGGK